MYMIYTIMDTIRVPPAELGGNINEVLLKQAKSVYEGVLDEDMGIIIAVTGIENVGDGRIVPGDGAAYYETNISMLTYKPKLQELIEGEVTDVTEFGAFVKTGPIEGLVHVSQIMDDYINYDAKLPGFIGKESKKRLVKKDVVLARVATVSLKGTIANSKVGLTMRQLGLGKPEWLKIDLKEKAKKKEKTDKTEKKEKQKKE
jgi:DNA-directed RNA polymerase subunit E'